MKIDDRDRFLPLEGRESLRHLDFELLARMTSPTGLEDARTAEGDRIDPRYLLAWQRLGRAMAGWLRGLLRRRRIRRTIRELQALDDRSLRDIGLSRGQIHSAAREAEAQNGATHRGV